MKDLELDFKSLELTEPIVPYYGPTEKELNSLAEEFERKQSEFEYGYNSLEPFFRGFNVNYYYKKGNGLND